MFLNNKGKLKIYFQNNKYIAKIYFSKYSNLLYDETTLPYISIYNYEPKIYNDEDVIIPFYFTDFYQREYYYNDTSLKFKLRYELDGNVQYIENLTSGDHDINLGKLSEGMHWYSLQVIDEHGRESRRIFNDLYVVDRNTYPITKEQTYVITDDELVTYSINRNNSEVEEDMVNNRVGLSQLFVDLQSKGYRKCILPEGIYRINRTIRKGTIADRTCPILIPTQFTVDMNNSTFKLHPYDDREYGKIAEVENLMVSMLNTFDSHLINGTIEGDYFERQELIWEDGSNYIKNSNGEHSNGVYMYGAEFSTLDNVTIKQITGYNVCFGLGNGYANNSLGGWVDNLDIVKGIGIDKEGYVSSTIMELNKSMIDNKYITASIYLATGGLRGKYWDIKFHFYDDNQNFIETIISYQFTRCRIPENAKYYRVTFRGTSSDMKSLSIYNMRSTRYSSVKNCHWVDNRTCLSVNQAQHLTIKNCDFTRSGQHVTPSEMDFEDGWEQMQDIFIIGCEEIENAGSGDIIDQTGLNHVFEGNKKLRFSIGYRANGVCIRNNTGDTLGITVGFMTGNTIRVYNNEFLGISGSYVNYDESFFTYDKNKYKIKNNNLILDYTNKFNGIYVVDDCDILLGDHSNIHIINSRIKQCNNASYIREEVIIENSIFSSSDEFPEYKFSFNQLNVNRKYINCVYDCSSFFASHNNFNSGVWDKCTFNSKLHINPNSSNIMGDIQFNNCLFKGVVTINPQAASDCYIQFNNCTFEQTPTFLNYGESNSEFNNCILP